MTAVEYLFKELWNLPKDKFTWFSILKTAKEMEKEQIVSAWEDGDFSYFYSRKDGQDFENGMNYYDEKYGDEKNVEKEQNDTSFSFLTQEELFFPDNKIKKELLEQIELLHNLIMESNSRFFFDNAKNSEIIAKAKETLLKYKK